MDLNRRIAVGIQRILVMRRKADKDELQVKVSAQAVQMAREMGFEVRACIACCTCPINPFEAAW